MAHVRFSYLLQSGNLADGLTPTVLSEEAATFPAANATAEPAALPYRSTGVGSMATPEFFELDLSTAQTVDLIAIVGHNLSASAVITVNAGASSSPDGSSFTVTMAWRDRTAFALLAATESWRYWRIEIYDVANTAGFLNIGMVMVGAVTELASFFKADWTTRYNTAARQGSTVFNVPLVGTTLLEAQAFAIEFGEQLLANATAIVTLLTGLKGAKFPLFVIPDATINEGFFGRLDAQAANFTVTHNKRSVKTISAVTFVEDNVGLGVGV